MVDLVNCRGVGNENYTQVGSLITVQELKDSYLFGKLHFPDQNGNYITDETLQTFINNAVSLLEMDLDLAIMPRNKVEYKDYFANDYYEWGYMQLNNAPVIGDPQINIVYTKSATQFETVMAIPPEWIRLDPDTGIIRMIPNNKFPGRLAVGGGGAFFPELFQMHSMVPSMWQVIYQHGFKPGCIPAAMNAAIGLMASVYALNILGDLLIGAGIAGASLSLDNLSQSIQTTASAENHGFSALVKDYQRQLFGDRTIGSTGIIEALRRFYKGAPFQIL